jgi:hypothetical protein
MLPKLSESTKFKDEIRFFESKLKVVAEDQKDFIQTRINRIKELAKNIDEAHEISTAGFIRPTLISDSKEELVQARFEIYEMIRSNKT